MDLTMRACAQSPQQELALRQMLKAYLYLNSIPRNPKATEETSE